jgi:hypothetical protein
MTQASIVEAGKGHNRRDLRCQSFVDSEAQQDRERPGDSADKYAACIY